MTTARHTMALLERIDGPDLAVHPERCVLVRNRNADCLRCAQACTSGAISANDDGLQIDPDLCIGCGTCATVCPTGALEPLSPDDQALARAGAELATSCGGTVVFACDRAVKEARRDGSVPAIGKVPGCAEVACLGRIDATELVELAVRGAERVVLAAGTCAVCPHRTGGQTAAKTAEEARHLLAAFGSSLEIVETVGFPRAEDGWNPSADAFGYSLKRLARMEATPQEVFREASDAVARREGFETGVRPVAAATGDAEADIAPEAANVPRENGADLEDGVRVPHVGKDGLLAQFVPARRTRLFNCLKALGEPCQETLETHLWGTVEIDPERCDACRMCAVFCPTGALRRFADGEGGVGMVHQSTFCVQCGTCEAICPRGAITVSPAVGLEDFLHGTAVPYPMDRPDWKPNAPDSIYRRMVGLLGTGNNIAVY